MRGLNGSHGVLIPKQNIKNLNLSDEIVQAVKESKFHIYAVSTIDEGIEILTGSINYLAYEKLKHYAINSSKYFSKNI